MLSSSSGLTGLAGRAGMLYGAHAPPRLYHDDEDDDDEDDSTDEYGSCTEAPLYENVDDEEEQGVYENVLFEPPAYCNVRSDGLGSVLDENEDDQVYANVPGPEIEAPTYDVPLRRPPAVASIVTTQSQQAATQEYANLGNATVAGAAGGLGVILEESESSARSSSGSSGRGSSCTSEASSLARCTTPANRPSSGLSGLLARIRGTVTGAAPQPAAQDGSLSGSQRGSRDSGLNEAEWTSRKTTHSHEEQQATPERLARVQQQVRLHMQAEEHYQQPRPQPQQPKLSVRDLLGHFEARRDAAPEGAARLGSVQPSQRSYGFGSSTTVKTALRKSVSQPADAGLHNNRGSYSGPTSRSAARALDTTQSNGGDVPVASVLRAFSIGTSTSNKSPSISPSSSSSTIGSTNVATSNVNNRSNKLNSASGSNSVNNKLSHSTGSNRNNNSAANNNNNSRRSFLDSIIASAASADGGGRGSRRSSASMEQVNNILNATTYLPDGGRVGDVLNGAVNGGGHPALRKADSESSSEDKDAVCVDASHASPPSCANGVDVGSLQDIPSIVDQLPDDDRPQESRRTTSQWDPSALVAALYSVPEPLRDKPRPVDRVNLEGFLERLPSGRTKATFWNAWKRCYFKAKDGFLYCYAGKHSEKPVDVTQLMGGKVESFESMVITAQDRNPATVPVIGIDDRMGHYLVVRAGAPQETDRWMRALRTHTVEDFCSTYVQPWPVPRAPALLRDSIVVDLGSRSVRAGILCSQPSLPQVFFPAVCATRRSLAASLGATGDKVYGPAALQPSVRANSTLGYPVRPTERINKHTVDLAAVSGLLRVAFQALSVEPRDYGVVLSVPRTLDSATQSRLVAELFDRFGVRSVLLSHQSVLALYAYNAGSGVVVDIGERTDVVPIMDGYIVEGGVSRVPYGGEEMSGHVRRFLLQRAPPVSLGTVAEALLPRYALERLCFVSPSYRADLKRGQRDPTEVAASISVSEFFVGDKEPTMESLTLDTGRFQAPEGLFHPQAWGLDHPGVHRMVHKAIQECSMDARKTMARSVFLAGGLTMLPGFADRLREELAALLPPAAQPKVHASPYRYHAAYLGACVLANSSGVQEMCLTREEYHRDAGKLLRPWIL